jgi:hypothetical protein
VDRTFTSNRIAGFWRRQFQIPATIPQRLFDAGLGLALPVLCLILDPGILKAGGSLDWALLRDWRVFAYSEMALGLIVLSYFLITNRPSAPVAGALLGCFLFSIILGLLLLPLVILLTYDADWLGMLGLSPLVTGLVFLRNAVRCWRALYEGPSRYPPEAIVIIIAVLTLVIPAIPDVLVLIMTGPVPPGV